MLVVHICGEPPKSSPKRAIDFDIAKSRLVIRWLPTSMLLQPAVASYAIAIPSTYTNNTTHPLVTRRARQISL
jgi:hypothetical protein